MEPLPDAASRHTPVLLRETLELLAVRPGGFYLDGTLGLGGHAERVLERSSPNGSLWGLDKDAEALALASARLARFGDRFRPVHLDFRRAPELLGAAAPDGILLDLGVSSLQFDQADRGFSFRSDGPLDMRMDRSSGETAADLVNQLDELELADLIYHFGEEHASRRIARAIVYKRPFSRTAQLAEVVRRAAGRPRRGIDNATRTFQALRIAVNQELSGLKQTFAALARELAPGGRMVVISFHSLEDREAKLSFKDLAREGFEILTRKPVVAGREELQSNPRSRSAKLRALRRATDSERAEAA